jgi:uncharacterized protein YggE
MSDVAERENYISVTGHGRLFVDPNYIRISVSLACLSESMKLSLDSINSDMKQFFGIMDKNKIERNLAHVVDLSFGPDYQYNAKTEIRVFRGYRVDQKVCIEMDVTKENEEKAVKIIGRIYDLKFLSCCNIEYGLNNKKTYLPTVRELSLKNAIEKAEQYASLAGVRIIKVNTITENEPGSGYSRNYNYPAAAESSPACDSESDSYLPNGRKIVLENTVYVIFDIEKAAKTTR